MRLFQQWNIGNKNSCSSSWSSCWMGRERTGWRLGWLLLLLLDEARGELEASGGVVALLLFLGAARGGREAPGGVAALQPCRNLR
jgi:hypothetical protein